MAFAAILVLVNACFVAAEFAIVTVRRSRIEALVRAGHRRAKLLERITADLDAHISAVQLAITSIGIGIGWLAEPALASLIITGLKTLGVHDTTIAHATAFTIAFAGITATVIIAGELAPKFLGLRRTESVALWTAPLVYWFARLTRPVLAVMNRAAAGILAILRVTAPDPSYERMDTDELRIFISDISKYGRLSVSRRRMLEKAFEFAEHTARQIMIPRDKIDSLSLERPIAENLAIVNETGHTRYPLCESGLDSVVGMVHIKDLFQRASTIASSDDLRLIQHDMVFVPESQPIDLLQSVFQKSRSHMAIVVDEYGVPTGLVTMEDVLEELVGEILDEFDIDEVPMIERSEEGLRVDGMLLIEELCRELEIDLATTHADTIGGYVTTSLGRIPRVGDRFKLDGWDGRVIEMQGRRVARVILREHKRKSTDPHTDSRARAGDEGAFNAPTESSSLGLSAKRNRGV